MKRALKLFVSIAIFLSFSCLCVGYAAVSGVLEMVGTANATAPEQIFISEIVPSGENAVTNSYTRTYHNSTVNLGTSPSSTASFEITVYNNTGYTYYFDEMVFTDTAYDNTNIQATLSGIEAQYELPNGRSVTFTVTFSYKNTSSITNTVLNSVINYQFVPNKEDAGDIAVDNVLDKFKEILNDDSLDGAFEYLIENMETDGRRANETYIGNVVGADSADTSAVETLFTDEIMNYLILQIGNGETKDVTAIIKREPLDGNASTGTDIVNANGAVTTAGCEMTIYLTPDDIPADRLFFGSGGRSITVYCAVFTTDESGKWYQLSPLYEGTATTNNYDGSMFGTTNSFNTDTWRSSAGTYETEN